MILPFIAAHWLVVLGSSEDHACFQMMSRHGPLHSFIRINQRVRLTAFDMPFLQKPTVCKKQAVPTSLFFCKQAAKTSGIIERTLPLS